MGTIVYNNCKCLNRTHIEDASALVGYPVQDKYTMVATLIPEEHKATLKCYFCEYEATVDLTDRVLNLTTVFGIRTLR